MLNHGQCYALRFHHILDPGCPPETDTWNIQWGYSEPGTSEMQPCGTEFIGQ